MREYVANERYGFDHYESLKGVTLIKIDRNGTHYYSDSKCPKCGGEGYIRGYEHVEGGLCFLCNGTGHYSTQFVVRTAEYEKKLTEKRLAKARKAAPETNRKYFQMLGLAEDGSTWIVLGDTFAIKNELKAAGAKYDIYLGWHFDHEQKRFPTFKMTKDTDLHDPEEEIRFLTEHLDGTFQLAPGRCLDRFLRDVRDQYAASQEPESHYVGEIGDRIEIEVEYTHQAIFENTYHYQAVTTYIHSFKDADGNILIWKTGNGLAKEVDGKYIYIQLGEKLHIKGTVKEHSEYRHRPQTVLTRCKVI